MKKRAAVVCVSRHHMFVQTHFLNYTSLIMVVIIFILLLTWHGAEKVPGELKWCIGWSCVHQWSASYTLTFEQLLHLTVVHCCVHIVHIFVYFCFYEGDGAVHHP